MSTPGGCDEGDDSYHFVENSNRKGFAFNLVTQLSIIVLHYVPYCWFSSFGTGVRGKKNNDPPGYPDMVKPYFRRTDRRNTIL